MKKPEPRYLALARAWEKKLATEQLGPEAKKWGEWTLWALQAVAADPPGTPATLRSIVEYMDNFEEARAAGR